MPDFVLVTLFVSYQLLTFHFFFFKLLDRLMAGCQDKDETTRIASGDCIGELGAIEPSLLPRRIISRGKFSE